eukprot:TRINITY_DN13202_c1_g1_i2.p1 TRINITY_DN13202_c1_g1~~TRINITY_DN13202_c1_g1_i2.p1  ORF type:complete len:356 (+),score=63.30 TRINITY_DN13202_c1_g1_i2:34-1068(+)
MGTCGSSEPQYLQQNQRQRLSERDRQVYQRQYRPSQPTETTAAQRRLVERMNERALERVQSGDAEEEQAFPEREQCVVCFDARRSVVFEPCNHCLCCSDCAEVMLDTEFEKQGLKPQGCPTCKQGITTLRPQMGHFTGTYCQLPKEEAAGGKLGESQAVVVVQQPSPAPSPSASVTHGAAVGRAAGTCRIPDGSFRDDMDRLLERLASEATVRAAARSAILVPLFSAPVDGGSLQTAGSGSGSAGQSGGQQQMAGVTFTNSTTTTTVQTTTQVTRVTATGAQPSSDVVQQMLVTQWQVSPSPRQTETCKAGLRTTAALTDLPEDSPNGQTPPSPYKEAYPPAVC